MDDGQQTSQELLELARLFAATRHDFADIGRLVARPLDEQRADELGQRLDEISPDTRTAMRQLKTRANDRRRPALSVVPDTGGDQTATDAPPETSDPHRFQCEVPTR